jgi:prepilin-type N-terminal cleavage/methylation domain-containing protein
MFKINFSSTKKEFTPHITKDYVRGFTLLEIIIVIFVVLVGLTGPLSLITQTINLTTNSSSRLIAAYLGQEGIEIVRNIRDGNWLEQRTATTTPWNDGLAAGDWEADYNDNGLTTSTERNLKINGGFYNYDSGTETKFKRKITITPEEDYILKVSIQTQWEDRGKSYQMTVQENLYNWR